MDPLSARSAKSGPVVDEVGRALTSSLLLWLSDYHITHYTRACNCQGGLTDTQLFGHEVNDNAVAIVSKHMDDVIIPVSVFQAGLDSNDAAIVPNPTHGCNRPTL